MKRLISTVIWPISLLLLLKGCILSNPEPYYFIPMASHRSIESFNLTQIWVKENVFIQDDDLNPMMVASQGKVAFLGALDKNDRTAITVLGASEGDLQWQTGSGIPTSIFAIPSALYIGQTGGASVVSYDLSTGKLLWKTPLPARGLAHLIILDDNVNVQTSGTHDKFFVLNKRTGEIVLQMEVYGVIVTTPEVTFHHSLSTLEAVDTNTKNLLWNVRVDHRFMMIPIFTEDKILIRTDIGGIYCLDRKTGNVKWNTDNIAISNLAVTEDLVYFLTRDGKLQGRDLQSGEVTDFVQFDTDRFVLNGEAHIGGYHVAYDPDTQMIFAELGDSAQLFAFKITGR